MRYDINMYCVYMINMDPVQKKESSESRVAAWQLDHQASISKTFFFSLLIPYFLFSFSL